MLQSFERALRAAAAVSAAALLTSCGGGDGGGGSGSFGFGSPGAQSSATSPDSVALAASREADRAYDAMLATKAKQASLAKWSPIVTLPLVPASGMLQADGKLMFWAANAGFYFNYGGSTVTALYDPETDAVTSRQVLETNHDMFCPGTSRLPDGRLLVVGGFDGNQSSLYDPSVGSWAKAPSTNIARGYTAGTPLSDGSVMILGGSWNQAGGGRDAEVFKDGAWRLLSGIPAAPFLLDGTYGGWPSDAHMSMIPTGNGKVLLAGPTPNMGWLDTSGNGSWSSAGRRGDDTPSLASNTVMYDAGKILKVGGASWNSNVAANANAYRIDTTSGNADVKKLTSMAYPRIYANSVVLPDGQVVTVGGQTTAKEFSDDFAVLPAEIFDPQTETFTVLPAASVPRNYHSIATLLPDGRVLSAGGGLCACAADHPNLQILSPPYLFNDDGTTATRPVIASAPTSVNYGSTVDVATGSAVTAFSLIRLGAVTHTVNNDQRRLALSFQAVDATHYRVAIPSNPGLLLPGQWMLFALDAKGTPSIAKMLTVDATGAPQLTNPGNVAAVTGQALSVAITASIPVGVGSYSATGLPAGLTINASTGVISGTPSVAGNYPVTIRVGNGSQTVGTDVVIYVTSTSAGTGDGLFAQYFPTEGMFGVPTVQRVEVPYFDWGVGAPAAGIPVDHFAARWSGSVETPVSGAVQLRITADDGTRLWVGNQLVVDKWSYGAIVNETSIPMVVGQRYPLTIEYFEASETALMKLEWKLPGATTWVAVPKDRLYSARPLATTNLAAGKAATQSSVAYGGVASRAVDGNADANYYGNSVTHTNADVQPWWQVDLGTNSHLDLVQLWNRSDCCSEWLTNFTVFVSASDMTGRSMAQLNADASVIKRVVGSSTRISPNIGIPIDAMGRFVRVQLAGSNYMSLAEVMVYGGTSDYRTPTLQPISDQQKQIGAAVGITAVGQDPDGNALTYSATGLPPGVTLAAATGVISGAPTTAGSFTTTLTASNEGGKSASVSFAWTVLTPPPQVTSLAAPSAINGDLVRYAPVIGGSGTAQYSWNFGDGTADSTAASSAAIDHTYAAAGVYQVTLTIRTETQGTTTYRFMQAVTAAGTAAIGGAMPRNSSGLLVEPRSGLPSRLWVVNVDADTVSVLDTATGQRLREISVGQAPRTLARGGDGRIWVVNRDSASISIIDPNSLVVTATVALPRASQPFGIVSSPSDGTMFVALQATGQLLKLNGGSGAQLASANVGADVRHVAMSADGRQLLVSRFITRPLPNEGTALVKTVDANGAARGGEVLTIDQHSMAVLRTTVLAHSERTDSENQARGIPNYLGAPAISPDGKSAWIPSKQDNIKRGTLRDGKNLTFESTVRAVSSRIDLATGNEDLAGRLDHDNSSMASAALFHPGGAYLFVALETSRQVAVVDVIGKRELFRFEVGIAPQALALSPDGLTLYAHNTIGRTVSVLDLAPLLKLGQTAAPAAQTWAGIATEKLTPVELQGKQLFYDARDPRLARDSYMSCASCHNDGGHDGRVWDLTGQGEGLRRTIALKGRAGTSQGFLHWSANFDEVQDFEGQIRSLAGGLGLMSNDAFNTGTRSQPLGLTKAGMSADLDALATYVSSLKTFAPSPNRDGAGALTASAVIGKTLFTDRNCASCHAGTAFTASSDAAGVKNIGTIKPSSGKRLGGTLAGIDIPTLRDVWGTSAYLHDGSAATLSEAVLAHGAAVPGATLSTTELANLSDYLKQIGSEEISASPSIASPIMGGAQGTVFTDAVAPGQVLTGVIVRGGWWIDSIQGLATPANLPAHGGGGGNVTQVSWPAGEYLVRIYGKIGSGGVISQISFVTNTGRVYGAYGTGQGQGALTNFDYTVPAGNRVLGFTGRSGGELNAIGVVYGPR